MTTQRQVIDYLGEPTMRSVQNGEHHWLYLNYYVSHAYDIPIYNVFHHLASDRDMPINSLNISFNKDGTVKKYSSTISDGKLMTTTTSPPENIPPQKGENEQ